MGGNVTAAHLTYQIMKTMKEVVLDYVDKLIDIKVKGCKAISDADDAMGFVADIKELQRIKETIEKGE